jgi:hypothetical protein
MCKLITEKVGDTIVNNSYIVESLRIQQFPTWTNSPAVMESWWCLPYSLKVATYVCPERDRCNYRLHICYKVYKIIFLLEVFSPKYCILGGSFAGLPARNHCVFGTSCDRLSQHRFSSFLFLRFKTKSETVPQFDIVIACFALSPQDFSSSKLRPLL